MAESHSLRCLTRNECACEICRSVSCRILPAGGASFAIESRNGANSPRKTVSSMALRSGPAITDPNGS